MTHLVPDSVHPRRPSTRHVALVVATISSIRRTGRKITFTDGSGHSDVVVRDFLDRGTQHGHENILRRWVA